ncbi:MAG: prevent-host-death protein [Gemmatimonadota bacterium]|nr:prevent-host-death protein [Gemmatimonadota bacterium]
MIHLRNIYSLSDFQRNTREHVRRLKRTRLPEVLTINGRAELVVQDAASYQALLDTRQTDAGEASRRAAHDRGAPAPDPDPVVEAYKAGVDRTLLRENLRKSVEERMEGLIELQRLAHETRRAGRAARGDS